MSSQVSLKQYDVSVADALIQILLALFLILVNKWLVLVRNSINPEGRRVAEGSPKESGLARGQSGWGLRSCDRGSQWLISENRVCFPSALICSSTTLTRAVFIASRSLRCATFRPRFQGDIFFLMFLSWFNPPMPFNVSRHTTTKVRLTHYRPAMPFGNRKKYLRGSFKFSIVTI